ncbi:hypothetical protein Tco_1211119 [Tanacetum coccineum]
MDLTKARANQFLQINEMDEMRLDAYEYSISYKERTKSWHDKRIKTPINYEKGDKILLFNSHLWLFPGKLKLRWYRPFSVSKDLKNGAIGLYGDDGNEFIGLEYGRYGLEYGVLPSSGYGVLDLVSFVVFGECRHRYAVSSLMDTAYWLSEQYKCYLSRRKRYVVIMSSVYQSTVRSNVDLPVGSDSHA